MGRAVSAKGRYLAGSNYFLEGNTMRRKACKLFLAAALAVLGSTSTQARPPMGVDRDGAPKTTAVESFVRLDRPPAPEVWSFRVEYRERRGPQFPWGKWHKHTTITGEYNTAKTRANNVAEFLTSLSKNVQVRIIETRLR
jgi:hypothetical protein